MTAELPKTLHQEPNYDAFYRCLLQVGPSTLTGVEDWMVEWFEYEGTCSELLWREGMQEEFLNTWGESQHLAICEAHAEYIQAVQTALLELPISWGSDGWRTCPASAQKLDWEESVRQIAGNLNQDQVRCLVAAAQSPRLSSPSSSTATCQRRSSDSTSVTASDPTCAGC